MKKIDLRSDTVTTPTQAMRKAMVNAEVGDDVYGEDPTVNKLQNLAAEMLGFEAGLFAPSGVQANLIALLTHCQRGDEYIVGQDAHTYKYEGGGAAVLGSIQPQPIKNSSDGSLPLSVIQQVIKAKDVHFARTKLLCLENTWHGRVLDQDYVRQACELAKKNHLNTHLDGARLFNAVVKQGCDAKDLTQGFDSVSICLSKGLSAPVGSVLCGSKAFIQEAKHWRKMLGGGMRQAGILAAAGILALTEQVQKLATDHEHAKLLAEGLSQIDAIKVDMKAVQTNMVFVEFADKTLAEKLAKKLAEDNITVSASEKMRLVLHKDVTRDDVDKIILKFNQFFS